MKNIRVIAAGIAAAGFISCTVTTHGTSQAAAEGDFAGRNAPYYYHAEGIKAHTVKGDMQAGIACFGRAIQADSSYAPAYYEIAEILLETTTRTIRSTTDCWQPFTTTRGNPLRR